jgi:hypothetical protein
MQAGKSTGISASFINTQKSHDQGVVQITTLN